MCVRSFDKARVRERAASSCAVGRHFQLDGVEQCFLAEKAFSRELHTIGHDAADSSVFAAIAADPWLKHVFERFLRFPADSTRS